MSNFKGKNGFKRTLISSLIAMHCFQLSAQESQTTEEEKTDNELEVIEVKGTFSRNLESALNQKKIATTISDGISADDIDALPALDLGEALQAVPGVQLNREGERRESSVNLRGLPSSFTFVTANGQTIASPRRSTNPLGGANPFGFFDGAVFSGVTVVKTPRADMPEGGIAGTIDKKLGKPLSSKETMRLKLSGRYEELTEKTDPGFTFKGTKHFNDKTLGISSTIAYSKQNFRRDTIRINSYDPLTSWAEWDTDNMGQTYEEWKIANGVPANAIVEMPGTLRQAISTNAGDRLSATAGIEWKPTDTLTLGANLLYSQRDMGDNGYEQIDYRSHRIGTFVSPIGTPRYIGQTTDDGAPIWAVSGVSTTDSFIAFDNREWDIVEESQVLTFDAEWLKNDWVFEAAFTTSQAQSRFDELLMAQRFYPARDAVDSNPVNVTLLTGEGNIADYLLDIDVSQNPDYFDVGNIVWRDVQLEMSSSNGGFASDSSLDPHAGIRGLRQLGLSGVYEIVERDSNDFTLSAQKYFSDGFISSVKAGYRFNNETTDSFQIYHGSAGIDMNEVEYTSADIINPSYTTGDSFFSGEAPGFSRDWLSIDRDALLPRMLANLQETLDEIGGLSGFAPDPVTGEVAEFTSRGLILRTNRGQYAVNFDAEIESQAAYVMAEFDSDFADLDISGNIGVRYVGSDVTSTGAEFDGSILTGNTVVSKHDYDFVLPSFNLIMEPIDDLLVRVGYSKGIVRPNLRATSPITSVAYQGDFDIDGSITYANVQLPGTTIDPYKATSYDLSVEWYNREGSAITLALFKKDISNFFEQISVCDNAFAQSIGIDDDLGNLTLNDTGDLCITSTGVDGALRPGDEVRMTQWKNVDGEVSVSGYELSVQQNLDFLPEPWNGFGGQVNYSRTKQETAQSDGSNIELPGVSDDTLNAILYYESKNWGVRFSYNYRSDYQLVTTGTFNGTGERSVKGSGRLDLNAYYRVAKRTRLNLRVYNMTETKYEEFEEVKWQPRTTHWDGTIYTLSLSHRFF